MPLTNAEKQARSRQRKAERVARYEAALREIAASSNFFVPPTAEDWKIAAVNRRAIAIRALG